MHNIFLLWIPLICSRVRPLIMSHLHKWHWWGPPSPVDCSCMHSAKWHLYNNQDGKRTNVIAWFTFKGHRTDCIQSGELLSLYLLHLETIYLTLQLLEGLLTSSKLVAWRLVPDPLLHVYFNMRRRLESWLFGLPIFQDIKALFPSNRNPFYAGFGNRDTDEFSYIKVGIPKGKIFIINPKVIAESLHHSLLG